MLTSSVSAPRVSAHDLLGACTAARGRGLSHYRTAPSAIQRTGLEADGVCVAVAGARYGPDDPRFPSDAPGVHCCVVHINLAGRAGNCMLQYAVGRLYAEMHSCAMPTGNNVAPLGAANWKMTQSVSRHFTAWPPAGGEEAFHERRDLSRENFQHAGSWVDSEFLRLYTASKPQPWLLVSSFFEMVDMQYTALSFAWDLGGESLLSSGILGLAPAVLERSAVVDRSARWGVHRSACAAAGIAASEEVRNVARVGGEAGTADGAAFHAAHAAAELLREAAFNASSEALHPWTPEPYRLEYEALLRGTAAFVDDDMLAFVRDPERTVVIHMRFGDVERDIMREMAWRKAHGSNWGDWGEIHIPRTQSMQAEDDATALDVREFTAATPFAALPPMSFYTAILDATRSRWDRVLLVMEASGLGNPIVRALMDRYGAVPLVERLDRAMATLLLARVLILSTSTFSFAAALYGRARVIHAPYMGAFHFSPAGLRCLLPFSELDSRWVFHDVFRTGVERFAREYATQALHARAAGVRADADVSAPAGLIVWRRRPLVPLPMRSPSCPATTTKRHGEAFALAMGGAPPPLDGVLAATTEMPVYFLSFRQLASFHTRLDCADYYMPIGAANTRKEGGKRVELNTFDICTDALHIIRPWQIQAARGNGSDAWVRARVQW